MLATDGTERIVTGLHCNYTVTIEMCTSLIFQGMFEKNKEKYKKAAFGECFAE